MMCSILMRMEKEYVMYTLTVNAQALSLPPPLSLACCCIMVVLFFKDYRVHRYLYIHLKKEEHPNNISTRVSSLNNATIMVDWY